MDERVNPGAVDTDSLDDEVKVRHAEREYSDALKWLLDGDLDAAYDGRQAGLIVPPRDDGMLNTVGSMAWNIGADLATGLVETPRRAVVGGARDALEEMRESAVSLDDWVRESWPAVHAVARPLMKIPPGMPGPTLHERLRDIELPEIAQPTSVSGAATRSITQFITGFDAAPSKFDVNVGFASSIEGPGYVVQSDGMCLTGILEDNEFAIIDPDAPIAPLDIVAVVYDGCMQMMKVFVALKTLPGGERAWAFGQLNPLQIIVLPQERVNVVHRVASVIGQDGQRRPVAAIPANSFLGHAADRAAAVESLNPEWRPLS
jgi:hypothetical protein